MVTDTPHLYSERYHGKRLEARDLLRRGLKQSDVARQLRSSPSYVRKIANELAEQERLVRSVLAAHHDPCGER